MSGLTHTLQPSRVANFFTQENYDLISCILTNTLAKEYNQKIVFTPSSIARECDMIHNERPDTVPNMNQRVILSLLQQFRNESDMIEKNNYLMENYWHSYNYDPILGKQPFEKPKLNTNSRGFRFHFTF